jgi:hypothetical protein
MPQMSTASARQVDPVLTTAARGYKNAMFIGGFLFPTVQVGQRAGKVISFGRESFRLSITARAPGQNVARTQYGYTSNPYALADYAEAGTVPIEVLQEANAVPGIDLAAGSIQLVQDKMGLRLEKEQADLARNAALYAASNKIALSGTAQFSDYANSDPFGILQDAISAVRAKVGLRPTTVLMGASVWDKLKFHPKLTDRFKYTGRDSITIDMMANLLEVPRVVKGDSVFVTGQNDAQTDVWGKDIILAYTNVASLPAMGAPSYGYTYQLNGYPNAFEGYYDPDTLSWVYPYADAVQAQMVGAEAGYLITNAVA